MKARTNNFIRSFTYFYFYRIHFVKLRYLFLIISRIIRWTQYKIIIRTHDVTFLLQLFSRNAHNSQQV